MTVVLTLGPVLFEGFEIPDKITGIGGKQMMAVHKLPGGSRVIDTMGRDDADPKWSARLRGSDAEVRAKELDYLRIQGQPIQLTWSIFKYSVIIDEFLADYENPFEIPYSITLCVVADETSPLLTALLGLDAAIGSDLNNVIQIGAELNIPGVTTAIGGVAAATSSVTTFEGASTSVVTAVQGAIGTALSAVNGNIGSNNDIVAAAGNVAGVVAGGDPSSLATSLTAQSDSFSALGQLYQVQSSLQRMYVNVGSGGS